jgi:hypothetical protein
VRLTPLGVAVVGLCALALVAGDPRAARDAESAAGTVLWAGGLAVAVAAVAWRCEPQRRTWALLPCVAVALVGGLCGWIGAAEILGDAGHAVRLAERRQAGLFLIGMTAAWMALPPIGVARLLGRGRSRA